MCHTQVVILNIFAMIDSTYNRLLDLQHSNDTLSYNELILRVYNSNMFR